MKEEYVDQLMANYPKLFAPRGRFGPAYPECRSGWFNIIESLCKVIQFHVDRGDIEQPVIQQIKEKFGGLRFYHTAHDEKINVAVELAEALSTKTCEVCGKPGKLRPTKWIQTLCDEHFVEQGGKLEEVVEEKQGSSPAVEAQV